MIDGGRVKLRKATRRQKGQGKSKTQKRRFKTEWREVKQIIVFEMDEQGRMKKGTEPIVDGTFLGPDEIMEVLTMRLHQVGAAVAKVVAFRCDGAPWIWDRLDWVKQRLGLSDKQVSKGLDWCHAVHHVSLALEPVLEDEERKRVFKKLRKWLKAGRWQKVVDELVQLATAAKLSADASVWTEIAYLGGHGEEGHLDYATLSAARLAHGQRRDRERDSPGDQFAFEGQQYFLGGGQCGRDAAGAWPGAEWPLEYDVREDHRQPRQPTAGWTGTGGHRT